MRTWVAEEQPAPCAVTGESAEIPELNLSDECEGAGGRLLLKTQVQSSLGQNGFSNNEQHNTSFWKRKHSTLSQQKFSSYFSWEKAIISCWKWTQQSRVFRKYYRECKEYIRCGTAFWSYTDPSPAAQQPLADSEYPINFFPEKGHTFS